MKRLQTIEEIHKRFNGTGSEPLLVTCNDLQDWVCKYSRFPNYLVKEYIGSVFARIWGIKTPEISFIEVQEDHIDLNNYQGLQLAWFRRECFGSLFLTNAELVTQAMLPLFNDKNFRVKLKDKMDYLLIALFDIWTANEDRNHNNYNLLLNTIENANYLFYTIDHETIFNSSFLERELEEITEEETILNTEIAKILFAKNKKINKIVDELVEKFYLCIGECEVQLKSIIDDIPESWDIDKEALLNNMKLYLFSEKWKTKCVRVFRTYVQTFITN